MNERIDVLAVMDGAWRVFASQSIRSGDGADFQADAVKEARAAVAELIEADRDLDEAQDALVAAKREKGNYRVNSLGHGHPAVVRVRAAKERRAAALARVGSP